MSAKRRKSASGGKSGSNKRPHSSGSASELRVRQRPGEEACELVLPRCARDRQEDLEEVQKMLDAGEIDVAHDECLWLLQGCPECLDAHRILGEIALGENDLSLARGHFGYAFRLGQKAVEQSGRARLLPYRVPANQSFLESGKALAWCLKELGKADLASEVIELMLSCDPDDTLGVRGMLSGESGSC